MDINTVMEPMYSVFAQFAVMGFLALCLYIMNWLRKNKKISDDQGDRFFTFVQVWLKKGAILSNVGEENVNGFADGVTVIQKMWNEKKVTTAEMDAFLHAVDEAGENVEAVKAVVATYKERYGA